MRGSARFLFHNVVVHPLCGALWFVGANRLGDWLHARSLPPVARAIAEAAK